MDSPNGDAQIPSRAVRLGCTGPVANASFAHVEQVSLIHMKFGKKLQLAINPAWEAQAYVSYKALKQTLKGVVDPETSAQIEGDFVRLLMQNIQQVRRYRRHARYPLSCASQARIPNPTQSRA